MNYAEEIKERLTMDDVARHYGYEPNRGGFINCPFHNEKTSSLKIYDGDKGFHCFGCGAGGDVIKFVMMLHSINFEQAITKLNGDFNLMLPIGNRMTAAQRREMIKADIERKKRRKQQEEERQKQDDYFWSCFDEYHRLEFQKVHYAPRDIDEEPHPLFIEAIQNISQAKYKLDCAEIERWMNGKERNKNT